MVCQPSTFRMLICPEASSAQNNMAAKFVVPARLGAVTDDAVMAAHFIRATPFADCDQNAILSLAMV